jgi:hypothetical protein
MFVKYVPQRISKSVWKDLSNIIWSIKALFIFHNDAHSYKITGILKQLQFRRSLRHVSLHAGTIIREDIET